MKNVNFDVYEYIINLVKQGYDVDSISKTLNLEKSYVVSMHASRSIHHIRSAQRSTLRCAK